VIKHFLDQEITVLLPTRLNVTFPVDAHADERALLYAASVFVDYKHFGGRGQTQRSGDQLIQVDVISGMPGN
jgi:hypothetical protein